jgi:hypothetical protein
VTTDICPYLKRREGGLFVCTKSGKQIDVAFRPCLLPEKERVHCCPLLWGEKRAHTHLNEKIK